MSDKSVGGYDGEGVYTRLYIVYRAVRVKKVIDASTRFIWMPLIWILLYLR